MENEFSIQDYLLVLKRRWLQVAIAFFVSILIITIIVLRLPNVYRSEGIIAIESPVISEDIIKQTYASRYANESLDKVKDKIYSKDYLLYLNKEFNLYPSNLDEDKILTLVSSLINISPETKNTSLSQWSSEKITVALNVGVEYSNPETAYKMASEVIQELLEANEIVRKKRITETTTYLTEELDRLKSDLDVVEGKVAEYKQKYANSLPEHQEMHMATLEQLRTTIKDLNREYKTTQEELRYLDVELTSTEVSLSSSSTRANAKNTELQKARAELDRSLAVYNEIHPTIKALRRKITLLENTKEVEVQEETPVKNGATIAAELALSKIRTQIQAAKVRLETINNQQKATNAQIAQLQSQILQIPQVERGLVTLQRDYENAKQKYDEVKAKQINAKIAENLELEDKSERFILKYSPELPKYRVSPKRKILMLGGLFVALGIGIAFAIISEWLDPRVRGQENITAIVGMRLLSVVPYIETNAEINKSKKIKKSLIILTMFILIIVVALAVIHFFVTPLNSLLETIK
jgi:polysaccharide biosynthesis transport protein